MSRMLIVPDHLTNKERDLIQLGGGDEQNTLRRDSYLTLRPPRLKTKCGQNSLHTGGGGVLRFGTHCQMTVN